MTVHVETLREAVSRLHRVLQDTSGEGTQAWAAAVDNLLDEVVQLRGVGVLEAMGACLRDRDHDPAKVQALLASVDEDAFWSLAGPVVDWLEDQLEDA